MSTAVAATTAQGPVEARSLSAVTAIASNPPPIRAIRPRRSSTRWCCISNELTTARTTTTDIFLSPLKPPTKSSISAEAINASLYYLHVATPDDDALLQQVEREREEQVQLRKETLEAGGDRDDPAYREFARLNNVRRKPVGKVEADVPEPPQHQELPLPLEEHAPPPSLPPRPAPMPTVSAENVSFPGTPITTAQTGEQLIARRPLPHLPNNEESWSGAPTTGDPSKQTNRWSTFAEHRHGLREKHEGPAAGRHSLDSHRPPLPPRHSHVRPGSAQRSPGQSPTRRQTCQDSHAPTGFHITLIRRDPATGTQWNVGTISTPRMNRNAIDIEISTPGYNRFIGSNEPLSLAEVAANLPAAAGRPGSSSNMAPPATHPSAQPSAPRKFHRELCVSKPFDESTAHGADYADSSTMSSRLKSGYYVFSSPWNGTCTFSSSVNGRSLKCKHMISGPGGKMPAFGDAEAPSAVTVAELRFNTPFQAANLHTHVNHASHKPHPHHISVFSQSQHTDFTAADITTTSPTAHSKRNSFSQLLNPNTYTRPRAQSGTSGSADTTNKNHLHLHRRTSLRTPRFPRQNQFQFPSSHSNPHHQPQHQHQHHHNMSTSSGGPDSDEDRLDLSLAREPAGGGMRGKSAKLGKLVVEDEGIKMLDLVVAACMAVWWRGYYY
ncbi:hypothetical protein N7510_009180 [Penicillium lagena]|uniref:uncharacterized protein n=1 Tax=Penicillium lagena TaxID=94218 RepID=UPI002540BF8B|nr:uncharacterized protein N7510_009180 [Penicillium lagena]KAJ5606399.1 hypothetical protein N7510_009180 [Penicillium lagena]